jgi:DNA-binding SARP family transcriptional activator
MSSLESVSPDDKRKLDSFMAAAQKQLQEIDDIRGGLKDMTKALAEELGVKPKELRIAAQTAFKNDLAAKKESMDTVIDILNVTGHG